MRKILISMLCIFVGFSAYCAGENIPTSKSYVDSALSVKQDIIEGTNDLPQLLTNSGVAGEYGTKDIYDSTASYSGQSKSLIDAVTMNTAVQNAIDTEFVCIEWVDPNDHTSDCLLMDIRGTAPRRSPNLFDISKVSNTSTIVNNGDGSITARGQSSNSAQDTRKKLSKLAPDLVVGKTYTFSFESEGLKYFTLIYNSSTGDYYHWRRGTSLVMTQQWLDSIVYFQAPTSGIPIKIWNVQIEEGTVATPYQPYGNIYTPAGN